MPLSMSERIAARSRQEGDCIVWTGYVGPNGYAYVKYAGKMMGIHRAAWLEAYGELPELLDHACSNRACVNLAHLRPATAKTNMEHRKGANKNNSTGVRGVRRRSSGTFSASVGHNRKLYSAGNYKTVEEAAAAAEALRAKLFTMA